MQFVFMKPHISKMFMPKKEAKKAEKLQLVREVSQTVA